MNNLLHKLRSIFLTPNSSLELILRTLYHKIAATKIFFRFQHHLAKRSYRKCRSIKKQKECPNLNTFPHQPSVTFLLSCSKASLTDLRLTIQSIQSLHGDNWEVLLVNSAKIPDTFRSEAGDSKVKRVQSDHPNLLSLVTGDFVIFCEAGDQFSDTLLWHFYRSLSEHHHADLLYYDCEYDHDQLGEPTPFFKPSALSPALLLSVNYLSRGFIKRDALQSIWAEVAPYPDLLCQEYEIALRLFENSNNIKHIPALLVHQKRLITPGYPEIQNIIEAHLARQGLKSVSSSPQKIGCRFSWLSGDPSLAIVIPSKNNRTFLEPLVHSLLQLPYQGRLSIHIVDNGSVDPATLAYYQTLQQSKENVIIISYNKPFNYSEAINLGVTSSASDLVLLLNDDMALIDQEAIPELVQWAIRPEIGVVGAKLLRANHSIQHAGIILGMTEFMGHVYLNAPEHYNGLFGSVDWYRNYLALTGACQMVRRDVFEEVGGYDPGYQLAFGDVAFCVRVHEKGYQNIYTPFAQLYHYEGSSRGYHTPVTDVLRGYDQLETYMTDGDPLFSPNLTYTRIPKCDIKKRARDERKEQIAARKRFYLKKM
jgi:O-antigen biosynthesis protein